jgi:UDP-N-acetylmuramate--alanine ligase
MCQEGMADVVGTTLSDVRDYSEYECDVDLKAPGRHNYENAKAALAVADLLHVDPAAALKSVSEFAGTWRRFESRGSFAVEGQGVSAALVYDDYAHHPTEVRATLAGAKERFQGVKKVVVFQPHTYTRTKALLADFGEAFKDADRVIVLPIYAAREPHDETISSSMVADKITASGVLAEAVESHEVAVERVRAIVAELARYGEGCVVFTMGAGDVRDIGDSLLS